MICAGHDCDARFDVHQASSKVALLIYIRVARAPIVKANDKLKKMFPFSPQSCVHVVIGARALYP